MYIYCDDNFPYIMYVLLTEQAPLYKNMHIMYIYIIYAHKIFRETKV